ncbi:hypothetical protein [Streptomyces kanamyceticus]|uniref:hypothetical protein n=1 Tax=Streptomyces kanamyceticus TaxID=1967 RepID=UPI0006E45BAB|nr:hypothetical protein [Streptomyces kanamyceticus]
MDESLVDLRASFTSAGGSRLSYADERPEDRDVQGALWARVSQSLDEHGVPTGAPLWRMVNPIRQRETMLRLRCQFCREPARTQDGILFVLSAEECVPEATTTVRTAQPPFCLKHARMAPRRCSHLAEHGHVALLAQSAPLYGVIGTPHRYAAADRSIHVLASDGVPVPYGGAALDWMIAAQLVRTLRAFKVINLDDL